MKNCILVLILTSILSCSKDDGPNNRPIVMEASTSHLFCLPNTYYSVDGDLGIYSQVSKAYINEFNDEVEFYGFCFDCDDLSESSLIKADRIDSERYFKHVLPEELLNRLINGEELKTAVKYKNESNFKLSVAYVIDPLPEKKIQFEEVASLPIALSEAVAFSVNNLGFLGSGFDSEEVNTNQFFKYDATDNTITKIANYPEKVYAAFSFVIDGIPYVGGGITDDRKTGSTGATSKSLYSYDVTTDEWAKQNDLPAGTAAPAVLIIDKKAYIVGGTVCNNCIYIFDPVNGEWSTAPYSYQNEISAMNAVTHSNGKSYVVGQSFIEFDGTSWFRKQNCPMPFKPDAICFSKGEDIYAGLGWENQTSDYLCNSVRDDFWKYDVASDRWNNIGITDGLNVINYESVSFKINEEIYIATGKKNEILSNKINKLIIPD